MYYNIHVPPNTPPKVSQQIRLIRGTVGATPSEQEAEARLHQEGYRPFRWTDVPGSTYPRHQHMNDECIWVISGEITINIENQDYILKPGDRLYLPKSIPHTACVPLSGPVTYLVGEKD